VNGIVLNPSSVSKRREASEVLPESLTTKATKKWEGELHRRIAFCACRNRQSQPCIDLGACSATRRFLRMLVIDLSADNRPGTQWGLSQYGRVP
jgi:hypothetical protein